MPFVNLTTIDVTDTYLMMNQAPARGSVIFEPPAGLTLLDPAGDQSIVGRRFEERLDINGSFSVALPTTDDPFIVPQGWTYKVTELIFDAEGNCCPNVFYIAVPYATPGGVLELSQAPRLDASGGVGESVIVVSPLDDTLFWLGILADMGVY